MGGNGKNRKEKLAIKENKQWKLWWCRPHLFIAGTLCVWMCVCVLWHSPMCEQLTWSKHALTAITLALNLPAPSASRPSFSLPLQMYSLAFSQPKFDEFSMATADPRFSRCTRACVWFWQKKDRAISGGFFLIGWSCGAMSGFYDPPQFLRFHRTDHFLKVTPQPLYFGMVWCFCALAVFSTDHFYPNTLREIMT